jgi:hypothetical protein
MSISRLMQMAAAGAGGDYQISRSLRFNSADSAYLSRTFSAPTAGTKWTWSSWVKRSALYATKNEQTLFGTQGAGAQGAITFSDSSDFIQFKYSGAFRRSGPVSFRDVSAWYHIVVSIDTTDATESNRAKLYVNGIQQTWTTSTSITQNDTTQINQNVVHNIGSNSGASSSEYSNIYLAETYFIDGSALTPSSFGETNATTGVWSPIAYAGSYGTNGFYLNFSDNSGVTSTTLGKDQAGSNNWTPSGSPGFSVTAGAGNDSLVDVPTRNTEDVDTGAGGEVRGNYCTANPLDMNPTLVISNGNLNVTENTGAWLNGRCTFGMSSGKWYAESTVTGGLYQVFGIANSLAINTGYSGGSLVGNWAYGNDGSKIVNGVYTYPYGATFTTNDVIGMAFDADAGTLTMYKNGVSQGVLVSGLPANTYFPWVAVNGFGGDTTVSLNFGQRPFAHTAPSGFKALVTTNLPEPTVVQGDDYFNTVLYTGNTPSTNAITGVGFAPDWVWVKSRTVAEPSNLVDRVRGDNLRLKSSTTDAESAATFALNSDGFTVGANSESNTGSMVAWNWKANGAGASNEDGTVAGTVTVSANTTAGISIVTWTNPASGTPTIGHGLVVAPSFIIVKDRTFAYNWDVGCDSIGWANRLNLNTAGATSSGFWDSTAPTASVFTYAASGGNSGDSMVAYCFAAIPGFSAFGSYTGNGLADGPFVYTGFRPAWILFKVALGLGGESWTIYDTKRGTYNVMGPTIFANLSIGEATNNSVDVLSNGFKLRSNSAALNYSTATMIFAAFAEFPFKYSLAR